MKHHKPSGIKEIARLAGVSIGTVDRALHNRGRVAPATQQKVEEIARRINYRPNLMARSLVINRKTTVAMLIPEPGGDEYWGQAYGGMEYLIIKFRQYGIYYEPYFYKLDDKTSFNEQAKKILTHHPDGVILAPNFLREGKAFFDQCYALSIPVIMFDTTIPDTLPLCYIGTDSYQSGRVAAELLTLTAPGEGKLAILHFDEELMNSPHMLEKERGFLSYLQSECPDREYIVAVLNNRQHHYRVQLDKMLGREKISGIFVSTSKAYRIGRYLRKAGIGHITLVGYDLTAKNRALLEDGTIRFLINQNPRRQAEESLNAFYNYLIYREPLKPRLLFPIEIITRTNLPSFQEG